MLGVLNGVCVRVYYFQSMFKYLNKTPQEFMKEQKDEQLINSCDVPFLLFEGREDVQT